MRNSRPSLLMSAVPLGLSLSGCVAIVPFVEPDYVTSDTYSADQTVTAATETASSHPVEFASPVVAATAAAVYTHKVPQAEAALTYSGNRRSAARFKLLLTELASGTTVKRTHAAFWLGELGPRAKPAVPALATALKYDESNWVRRAAAKALAKIGDRSGLEPLRSAQRDPDQWVRHSAVNAFELLSKNRLMPTITASLK